MPKQQKRPTRRDKTEASRLLRIEESRQLKGKVNSLEKRVAKLEGPTVVTETPEGRPGRAFIGKKETNE